MPKKGDRQPWRVTFQYGTQAKPSRRAHYTLSEAESFAEELRDTAVWRKTTVSIKIENRDTGAIMADTETNHAQTVEQIVANSERAVSLAEADNTEGLEELGKETETLISSLPSRGRFEPEGGKPRSWAQVKKDLRQQFREASQAKPAPTAEVVKPEPAPPAQYTDFAGVPELVTLGAERVAEGVRLHLRTSEVAKEIASVALDICRRIPNKDGNPDIMLTSQQARNAMSDLYAKAGEGFERTRENEKALKSLQRSVQYYRGDIRAQYLRQLDGDSDEAQAEREAFAGILAGKPDDVPASQWVANHYGTALKGQDELEQEDWERKQITGSDSPSDAPQPETPAESPDVKVKSVVQRFRADLRKISVDDFESASEETKSEIREELEQVYETLKAMLKATI